MNQASNLNHNLTRLVFLLDKSSSMYPTWDSTIEALNGFFDTQKKNKIGEVEVTLVLFNFELSILLNKVPLDLVPRFNPHSIQPTGSTALYYAMGKTIDEIGLELSNTPEHKRPGLVHFITMTDGYENYSRNLTPCYVSQDIKSRITTQKNKYSWKFDFLGANQDAILVGTQLGLDIGSTLTYAQNVNGLSASMDAISAKFINYRASNLRGETSTANFNYTEKDRLAQLNAGANMDSLTQNLQSVQALQNQTPILNI